MNEDYGPIAVFFSLVFLFSVPFWILGEIFPVQLLPGLPLGALVVFAPMLAGLTSALRMGRLPAALQLLKRPCDLGRVRNKNWFFLFVLFNPAVALLVYGYLRLGTASLPLPGPFTWMTPLMCLSFFIAALAEEIGWTGVATGPLQRRLGILPAGLILGLVWTAFHLIVLRQADRSLEWIAWWSLGTFSLRIMMVWLYARAGASVCAAAIFHAMINVSWQLFPVNGSLYDPRLFSLAALILLLIIVSIGRPLRRE